MRFTAPLQGASLTESGYRSDARILLNAQRKKDYRNAVFSAIARSAYEQASITYDLSLQTRAAARLAMTGLSELNRYYSFKNYTMNAVTLFGPG